MQDSGHWTHKLTNEFVFFWQKTDLMATQDFSMILAISAKTTLKFPRAICMVKIGHWAPCWFDTFYIEAVPPPMISCHNMSTSLSDFNFGCTMFFFYYFFLISIKFPTPFLPQIVKHKIRSLIRDNSK